MTSADVIWTCLLVFVGLLAYYIGRATEKLRDVAHDFSHVARLVEALPDGERQALLGPYRANIRHLWHPDAMALVKALLLEAVEQNVAEGRAIEASMRVMADRIEGAAQIMEEIETRLRKKYVMVERVATVDGVTIGMTDPNPPIGR